MDLSSVSSQELALELSRRARETIEGRVDAAFSICLLLDAFRILNDEAIDEEVLDAEAFSQRLCEIFVGDLLESQPANPKATLEELVDWTSLKQLSPSSGL